MSLIKGDIVTIEILDEIEETVLTNSPEELVALLAKGYKLRIYNVISSKYKVYYLV